MCPLNRKSNCWPGVLHVGHDLTFCLAHIIVASLQLLQNVFEAVDQTTTKWLRLQIGNGSLDENNVGHDPLPNASHIVMNHESLCDRLFFLRDLATPAATLQT